MKTDQILKFINSVIILGFFVVFIIKFAGPNILRQYISYGIGDCKTVPILCMQPDEKTLTPEFSKEYNDTLVPQRFPKMSISIPKGFNVVQELIKRRYYKRIRPENNAVIYLLPQEPDAFIKLYPDVQKQGIRDNYEFIRRLMYANLSKVNNITDAFFIIMKSVFSPDIGPQNISRMIKFELGEKRGFINYTLAKPNNYFDCNVLDARGNFFKVYIKDIGARLDLNNVFTIISTLKPID
ncbi:MAG: hypothetical protein KJ710_05745 [Candidatus Omnitrophica bacterium]|nr:hypothetical protein [Candidatus Omnitrophota bacterium]MBU1923738.1 hypothetical protein [Candidatus Omnitrophota bacterium]